MNGVLVRATPLFSSCDGLSFGLGFAWNSLFRINCLRGQTSLIISLHKELSLLLTPVTFIGCYIYVPFPSLSCSL